MSVEDLKKFGQLCNDDLQVRNRAKEIGLHDVEGMIAYGRELGLEFTKEDMLEAAKEAGANMDELSEDDLEKIAGGAVTTTLGVVAGAGVVVGAVAGVAVVGGGLTATTVGVVGAMAVASGALAVGMATVKKW